MATISITLPRSVHNLIAPSFTQHVLNQETYSVWRSAMVSWFLAHDYHLGDSLLPLIYTFGMDNPLDKHLEYRLVLPAATITHSSSFSALMDAISSVTSENVNMTEANEKEQEYHPITPSIDIQRKRTHDKMSKPQEMYYADIISDFSDSSISSEIYDNNSDNEHSDDESSSSSSSDDMSQRVAYNSTPVKRASKKVRFTTPSSDPSEGISASDLAYLIERKNAEAVFGKNYYVLDTVNTIGCLIEGLCMVRTTRASCNMWQPMRIIAVDNVKRQITCDTSIFDTRSFNASRTLVTYNMDSYALRPIIMVGDTKQGAFNRFPEYHYCKHTGITGAIKTPFLTADTHEGCLNTVISERAIQGKDVVFSQIRVRIHK